MADLLVGADCERMLRGCRQMQEQGVDAETADVGRRAPRRVLLLDVAELAQTTGQPVEEVAPVYFAVSDRYGIDSMLSRISRLKRANRWEALARGALRDDLYAAWMGLTKSVLTTVDAGSTGSNGARAGERIDRWEKANAAQLNRAKATIQEVRDLEHGDLASMQVALRVLRGVIRAGSAS